MSSAIATGENDTQRMEEENKRAVGHARTAAAGFLAVRQIENELLTRDESSKLSSESNFANQS
jgi:hypothetical protein